MPRLLPDFKQNKVVERRLPDWLRKNISIGQEASRTDALLGSLGLNTICESGRCPNRNECYSQKTATFLIMGDVCTRHCAFCSVSSGQPQALDPDEPRRLAEAVNALGLCHAVVTSVTRDDLEDEGAGHFVDVIKEIQKSSADIIIEILTPDFRRTQKSAVGAIVGAGPDIFSHNVETVPSLYDHMRPQGDYEMSLRIFREIKQASEGVLTKSGLMLGLGETRQEVLQVLEDLRSAGCELLTLGQYLQSSGAGLPVREYVSPDVFLDYKKEALAMGFSGVESAPFVRSSFHAGESYKSLKASLNICKHG